jgi:hypothetical protein
MLWTASEGCDRRAMQHPGSKIWVRASSAWWEGLNGRWTSLLVRHRMGVGLATACHRWCLLSTASELGLLSARDFDLPGSEGREGGSRERGWGRPARRFRLRNDAWGETLCIFFSRPWASGSVLNRTRQTCPLARATALRQWAQGGLTRGNPAYRGLS